MDMHAVQDPILSATRHLFFLLDGNGEVVFLIGYVIPSVANSSSEHSQFAFDDNRRNDTGEP